MGTPRSDPILFLGAGHGEALGLLEAEPPSGRRAIRVEADGLPLSDLAAVLVRKLDPNSEDLAEPESRVETAIRELEPSGLLLLVGGGSGMLPATAAGLRTWIDRLDGELQVVVAMGPPAEEVLQALAPTSDEIQVGVLGPRPAAVRARRILAGPSDVDGSAGTVTMAQLAKARRRRSASPPDEFVPAKRPAAPEPPPRPGPEASMPAEVPPLEVDDGAAFPVPRPFLPTGDPPEHVSRDKEKPTRRRDWYWAFGSVAVALLAIGGVWWALGPVAQSDPGENRSVEERRANDRLPQVSVGPPPAASLAPAPITGPSERPPASDSIPTSDPKPTALPEPFVRFQETSSNPVTSANTIEESVKLEPDRVPSPTARVVAADGSKPEQPALAKAPLAEARSESAPEILPPVVRDPARIPEILRIGPPSSRAGAPEAEEVAAVGESATPVESLRVSIDAEPNALVRVNGELLGITPIPAAELSSGLHSFSIEFESGQVSERSVRVDEANQSFLFRLVPTGSRSPLPPGG